MKTKSHTIALGFIAEEERQGDVLIGAESYLAVSYFLTSWPEEPLSSWMVPGTYRETRFDNGGTGNADVHAN